MSMHLVCCTSVICNEVAMGLSQNAVAMTYALALMSAAAGVDSPDWSTINRAILDRWSMSGLDRIKKMAWKQAIPEPRA